MISITLVNSNKSTFLESIYFVSLSKGITWITFLIFPIRNYSPLETITGFFFFLKQLD